MPVPGASPGGSPVAGSPALASNPGPGGAPLVVEQVTAGIRAAQAGATAAQAQAQEAMQRARAAEAELARTRQEHASQMTAAQTALEATRSQAEQSRLAFETVAQQQQTKSAAPGRRFDIIDTRLMQKPQSFKGAKSAWPNWSFKLLSWISSYRLIMHFCHFKPVFFGFIYFNS